MTSEAKIVAVLGPIPAEVTALVGGALTRAGTNEEGQLVLEVNEDFPFTNEKPDRVYEIYELMTARFPRRISDRMNVGGRCVWVVRTINGVVVRVPDCDTHRVE